MSDEHAARVRKMFDLIAPRYNLMNTLMTFGRDRKWRRYVISQAILGPGSHLLDIATGTGDIVLEAYNQHPDLAQAVGADFSRSMMLVGRSQANGENIFWIETDAMALPFADSTFDAVTSGYLARNVRDVKKMFKEQCRVVKPGGRIVCLDTSPPPANLFQPFVRFYLRFVIPWLGWLITRDKDAYTYLPESTEGFKTPEELADIMKQVGLAGVGYRRFMFGTIAVHTGTKPL